MPHIFNKRHSSINRENLPKKKNTKKQKKRNSKELNEKQKKMVKIGENSKMLDGVDDYE